MRRILLPLSVCFLLVFTYACNSTAPPLEKLQSADGKTGSNSKEGTKSDAGPDRSVASDRGGQTDRRAPQDLPPGADKGTAPDNQGGADKGPAVDVSPRPDQTQDQGTPQDNTPPTDTGPDTPPADQGAQPGESCQSPCDCKQGLDCQNNVCSKASLPIYCCEKRGCPANETCVQRTGQRGRCTPPPQCVQNCDCPQGQACISGTCRNVGTPVFCCDKPGCTPGAPCYTRTGLNTTCKGSGPSQCKHTCDCPQGQACLNGTCLRSQNPSYCCDNKGCPPASICEYRVGGYGYCPKNNNQINCKTSCDCKLGEICFSGKCVRTQNPVYCCDRDKNSCPVGGLCEDKNGSKRICGSYKKCNNTCGCPEREVCFNGRCISSRNPTPCCSSKLCRRGQICVNTNGSFGQCN